MVAEKNFGCGSSREHAPPAIKCAGVSCVIAETLQEFSTAIPSISVFRLLNVRKRHRELKQVTKLRLILTVV